MVKKSAKKKVQRSSSKATKGKTRIFSYELQDQTIIIAGGGLVIIVLAIFLLSH